MYFVSGGAAMGGISWSSVMPIRPPGLTAIFLGLLYRFPGARFQCCPSPRSIGSFTV